jgi:hypothetical protein
MKNRYLWAGAFAHDTVGDILKSVRQESEVATDEQIIEAAREKMRQQFKASKEAVIASVAKQSQGGGEPEIASSPLAPRNDSLRLFEHEYNVSVNPAVWKSQWDNVERSLRWFLSSKWLARFKTLPPESWKAVDELLHFDVDGIKAFLKIDCAIETDGRFVIIDWKTSALKPADEFPLLLSALYAHEVWGADPENIDSIAVSLQDGRQMKAAINEESLMETFLRIQEEAAVLQGEIEAQAGLDYTKIPMTSDLRLCDRCNFKKMCHVV